MANPQAQTLRALHLKISRCQELFDNAVKRAAAARGELAALDEKLQGVRAQLDQALPRESFSPQVLRQRVEWQGRMQELMALGEQARSEALENVQNAEALVKELGLSKLKFEKVAEALEKSIEAKVAKRDQKQQDEMATQLFMRTRAAVAA